MGLKDKVSKLASRFLKDAKTAKLSSIMKDFEIAPKTLPEGYVTEEAGMIYKDLPHDVQKQLANSGATPEEVVQALYSKYFNYGVEKNKFTEMLPDISKLKLGAGAGLAVGAGAGALMPTSEAEASPVNPKTAKKILEAVKAGEPVAAEEARALVRAPKYVTPEEAFKNFVPEAKLPSDIPESAHQAALRMKWDFPPTANLPPGGLTAKEMSAEKEALEKLKASAPEGLEDTTPNGSLKSVTPKSGFAASGESALKLLSAPQRMLAKKIAENLGIKANPENSEETFQNIVEAAANKLGVPEDSALGNAAKAGAVAGAEVFADPLSLIPVGKISKAVKSAPGIAKALESGSKVLSPETAAQIERMRRKISLAELAQVLRPKAASETAAGALAAKGAKVIKPTHIVKSRP